MKINIDKIEVGNILSFKNMPVKVLMKNIQVGKFLVGTLNTYSPFPFDTRANHTEDFQNFSPVEITDSWILSFGLIKIKNNEANNENSKPYLVFEKLGVQLLLRKTESFWELYLSNGKDESLCKIQYVHELQNKLLELKKNNQIV